MNQDFNNNIIYHHLITLYLVKDLEETHDEEITSIRRKINKASKKDVETSKNEIDQQLSQIQELLKQHEAHKAYILSKFTGI